MPNLRALITELANELDHNRQCLLDDRRLTHPLADKARVALAEPEPEGPTDEDSLPNIKSRIEELQEEIRDLRISYVRLANAVAYIMPDRNKFFADLIPDFDDPS